MSFIPVDTQFGQRIFVFLMKLLAEQERASVNQKLAMIDELWEEVRRAGSIPVPDSHIAELERRVRGVREDPGRALSPELARRALRK